MDEQTAKFLNKVYILAIVLVAGVVLLILGQLGYQNRFLDQQNQNQITVSGEGKVYAKPDVAIVSLGVTTQATTVADVTAKNTTAMNAVIAAVKALKINDKDIQTTNYNLTPVYDSYSTPVPMMYPSIIKSGTTLTGYTLEQDVQVKIRDFTKVGDVLSQTTSAGANVVGSLQFTIDNPEQFKDQARAVAIKQAKANAQDLARASGVSLGKIINVYENNFYMPTAYNSVKAMGAGVADSAPAPTIQPGQQLVDITINITYQVK